MCGFCHVWSLNERFEVERTANAERFLTRKDYRIRATIDLRTE